MTSGRYLAHLMAIAVFAAFPALAQDETSLRSADSRQQAAAQSNDGAALTTMAHENFRLYAPEGYIGDRNRLIGRFQSAETGYTRFERTVQTALVTQDVGVVMGQEIIQRANQEPVHRRFTNIWLWEKGRWFWLARHAQIEMQKESE